MSPEQHRELERLRAEDPDDFRHGDQPPKTSAPAGARWVRCWKAATGPLQEPGWRWEAIDLLVADIVEQLQRSDGGPPLVPTAGCCGGHRPGDLPHVLLGDGRVLVALHRLADLGVVEATLRPCAGDLPAWVVAKLEAVAVRLDGLAHCAGTTDQACILAELARDLRSQAREAGR